MLQGTLIDELIETVQHAEEHCFGHALGEPEPAQPVLAFESPRTQALAGAA